MTECAKLLTCDRCKSYVVLHPDKTGDWYEPYPEGWTTVAYNCKVSDLCPTCSRAHESFMNGER